MKHYNIPIFLPELACPYRCVYCNQFSITGKQHLPDIQDVKNIIDTHLSSFQKENRFVEVAFFGGNFTGLPEKMQDDFLKIVQPYLEKGLVNGIRCSTRPDYIDEKRVKVLKSFGMKNIELGAQTTNDEVLRKCGRGHSFNDIERASQIIVNEGITLGLQMMIGLPFDTFEDDMQTARDIVRLGAKETRIYPCIVVKDTELERLFEEGKYLPLSLNDAVEQSAQLYDYYSKNGVKVLRIGLHTSKDLDNQAYVAGPYHNNFAEMVFSKLWEKKFNQIIENPEKQFEIDIDGFSVENRNSSIIIEVPENQINHAIGYKGENKKKLESAFKSVEFKIKNKSISKSRISIIASSTMPVEARGKLESLGEVVWLEPSALAYSSISSHPDIFFFCKDENSTKSIVYAPNAPKEWIEKIDFIMEKGDTFVGEKYPETVHYNAVGIGKVLIHNFKHTDPKIKSLYEGLDPDEFVQINVNQGYTRCNLLALNERNYITSDLGIKKTLECHGFEVFYVDPQQVELPGQKNGFFPGCCGIMNDTLVVCGSLGNLKECRELKKFVRRNKMKIIELYKGNLIDLGSIFFLYK